jgi:hypothetical protein
LDAPKERLVPLEDLAGEAGAHVSHLGAEGIDLPRECVAVHLNVLLWEPW